MDIPHACQRFASAIAYPDPFDLFRDAAAIVRQEAQELAALGCEYAGFNIQAINVQNSPRDKEKFANLKAELYWGLRMRFEAGDVAALTDERAIAQLATIRYSYNARGQLVIESKEDARKRGIKSPDRAEAIMLAFADREPSIIKYYEQELAHRTPRLVA